MDEAGECDNPESGDEQHGDLAQGVEAAEVDQDHVDDVRALAVGDRAIEHLGRDRWIVDRPTRVGGGEREHEDRDADEGGDGDAHRGDDRSRAIGERAREHLEYEHEEHRGERLDRELGEREIRCALHHVEPGHSVADGAEHERRGDAAVHQGRTDRSGHDERGQRDVQPVVGEHRYAFEPGEGRHERGERRHPEDHHQVDRQRPVLHHPRGPLRTPQNALEQHPERAVGGGEHRDRTVQGGLGRLHPPARDGHQRADRDHHRREQKRRVEPRPQLHGLRLGGRVQRPGGLGHQRVDEHWGETGDEGEDREDEPGCHEGR